MIPFISPRTLFDSLSEAQTPAPAIGAEKEDSRIYATYADILRKDTPNSAAVFDGMAERAEDAPLIVRV